MLYDRKSAKHNAEGIKVYHAIESLLHEADIKLVVTRKRVKNINFRLKPNLLSVSAPNHTSTSDIVTAISHRLDWAINHHVTLLKRQRLKQQYGVQNGDSQQGSDNNTLLPVTLWGNPQGLVMGDEERIRWYRQELKNVMPELMSKWQPIVGATANETRIKKMTTRWGSCNTRAKRVWLSVYLPAYPLACTEYVIVHELCHLHHANHSPAFWREVKRSMPDYKHWHDMLAGKSGILD